MSTVAERLAEVRERVDAAVARRQVDETRDVTLVGAAKRQPLEHLLAAREAGLEVFGENRVQEAEEMKPRVPKARWHLIGPLQSNKAARAVDCFDVVESLDRLKIARRLDRLCGERDRILPCFLQVNLGEEPTKSGFLESELGAAADQLRGLSRLRIVGLMAIPPRGDEPEASRPWFRRLRELRDRHRTSFGWTETEGLLSMGMSADFEIAVEEGASHVRVGTALFGERPAARAAC